MRDFEYFVQSGEVRKVSVDKSLAESLIFDMEYRIKTSSALDTKTYSKIVFENFYDALRDFCDALLALIGYKSYSHEASIIYLMKEGFDVVSVSELDGF